MNGSSWLLGGGYSWHSGDPAASQPSQGPTAVVANPNAGLSLSTLAKGPLGLLSPDGSLGRLTLPRGVAVDGSTVLVLASDGSRVFRYDPIRATLVPLAEVGAQGIGANAADGTFAEPRRFRHAANIAARDGLLYVADPQAHRVQVFELATLALVRLHEGLDDAVDVAAGRQGVYILDRSTGRVLRASAFADSLVTVVDARSLCSRADRIAIDRSENVYLFDRTSTPTLSVFVPDPARPPARPKERFTDAGEVRDRFDWPAVSLDGRGTIVMPAALSDPCGLRAPADPAARVWRIEGRIFVIDTRSHVVRVHLADGRLRHRFGPYGAGGRDAAADAADAWSPVDVVGLAGCVAVLDERYQTVHALQPGAERLRAWFAAPSGWDRTWRRIVDDGAGCVLLWDGAGDIVDRVDPSGRILERLPVRNVRGLFDRPRAEAQPLVARPGVRLTRDGALPQPPNQRPPYPVPAFAASGVWTSQWLDSEIYNCQWHVLELAIETLPPGGRLVVRTRTSNDAQSDDDVLASLGTVGLLGSWRDTPALVGLPQPDAREAGPRSVDVLVPSGPGQYLQLQVELAGSGITTPVVGSIRIRFPRESLLQYLPAIYSKPEEQRDFLDRFLSIVQTTWTGIEDGIETFTRFLDPDAVPDSAMGWLSGWLALVLEGGWSAGQNRRLLKAMPSLRTQWGTPAGMRAWLRVYLANLGNVEVDQLEEAGIPGIVESFVERRRVMLNRPGAATLCAGDGLWSPSVERRFQLGVFDQEGEVALVSIGSPDGDLFRHYAHSFRVYVPAAFVRTPDDEALIRRAIDLQKPAHTTYELVLVEPRLRIGDQSTIGLDTVIGAAVPGPLVCATVADAPSRPPYQRLGYDITLGCGCGDRDDFSRRLR